jgi:hypothetical protein
MGYKVFNDVTHRAATSFVPTYNVTRRAEEEYRRTGQLDALVDPRGYGVIRPSRMRFDERPDGLYVVTIGTPVPVETRLDTTGSMGGFVDTAMRNLRDLYLLTQEMLPGCDLQISTGIFGDCADANVLCRPQFEMDPEKIVHQLQLMTPQRGGAGNGGEDPHYGIFGGAYLIDRYINKIGLKGYDFTVTDEPARYYLDESQLRRIYGDEVFDRVAENGFEINRRLLPDTKEVVNELLKRAHGFVLSVGDRYNAVKFWQEMYGYERVVVLPNVDYLPHVQAVIVGLTEGTLDLERVESFLTDHNVERNAVREIMRSVVNIPIGAQAELPNYDRRPMAGDVFRTKTDIWPMDPAEVPALELLSDKLTDDEPNWL